MDEKAVRRVLKVIASIPRGTTLSYGQVADRAGLRSARLVGKILAETHDDIPWHRVVRSDGTPTPHLRKKQTALLRSEGVRFVNGRVVG